MKNLFKRKKNYNESVRFANEIIDLVIKSEKYLATLGTKNETTRLLF